MRHFIAIVLLLMASQTLRSELFLPSAFPTTSILSPDCTIVQVERVNASITISFVGRLASSDATLSKTYSTEKKHSIHLRNTSEDEAGAFSLFCDSVEALLGKNASIDIVTAEYRFKGSGIYLDFGTSWCRIKELSHEKKLTSQST